MRRWVVIAFIPAMIGVLLGARFVRAEHGSSGPTVAVCHISEPGSNAGKVINLKQGSAAVNAHESLHGDCEDFDSTDGGCSCPVNTDPRPTGSGDDDGEGGDDGDSGDDGDGDHGDGDHNDDGHPDNGDGDDTETGD